MSKLSLSLCLTLLASSLGAQSSTTLPAGFDGLEGNAMATPGWDTWASSTQKFFPARMLNIFDAAVLPWGAAARTISKVALRRDSGYPPAATPAHTKSMRLFISSNGLPPQRANWWVNDRNHGADKAIALGTATTPVTVNFPSSATPVVGSSAPFNVVIPLSRSFIAPAGAAALCFDWRIYSATATATQSKFRPDATFWHRRTLDGGRSVPIAAKACVSPAIVEYEAGRMWPGNELVYVVDTLRPGSIAVGWAGLRRTTPIAIPGTGTPGCELWVDAFLQQMTLSSSDPSGRVKLAIAYVPNVEIAVGFKASYQLAVLDPTANALGFAFTRGIETTIGRGYFRPHPVTGVWEPSVFGVTLFSYGTATTGTGAVVDPDNEREPFFTSPRCPILDLR